MRLLNYLSKGLLFIDSSRYILQTNYMSCALMLCPCLSLGLHLQCFTWLGNMVQRFIYIYIYIYIYTHFQRSAVRLTISRLSCTLMKIFHISRIQPQPTNICFISHLLKNFRILLSMNRIHLVTVSYHQLFQERQFQT